MEGPMTRISICLLTASLMAGCGKSKPAESAPAPSPSNAAAPNAAAPNAAAPKVDPESGPGADELPDEQKPTEPTPSEPAPTDKAAAPPEAPPAAETVPQAQKARLAAVYNGAWCIRKRGDRQGLSALYAAHGFADAAAFASSWRDASAIDMTWAASIIAGAANQNCVAERAPAKPAEPKAAEPKPAEPKAAEPKPAEAAP